VPQRFVLPVPEAGAAVVEHENAPGLVLRNRRHGRHRGTAGTVAEAEQVARAPG
jgi:hypothetical protein